MRTIYDVDKNFAVNTEIPREDLLFHHALSEPFSIHGVYYEDGMFRRMPQQIAHRVSEGVEWLHANTAGGRIRFRTNSSYVAIHAKMSRIGKMPHFALSGSAGFDLYEENNPVGTFMPPFEIEDGYESIIDFGTEEMRELTINFPLYSNVNDLYIGLSSHALVQAPRPYKFETPFVTYGSSITQGGCASRPGMAYQAILSRRFDVDFINLGFSGNAKAEPEISEYIKKLPMSVFVYDYDHNAPSPEYLANTHERMFLEFRQAQPDVPVIFMSAPTCRVTPGWQLRREIIRKTYQNALAAGDKNVYLVEGPSLMGVYGDEGLVDACHPTDLGFFSMAEGLNDVFKKLYE